MVKVVTVPSTTVFISSYPSGASLSVHVYLISTPLLYFGSSFTVAVQSFSAFRITSVPLLNVTSKLDGRFPS